MTCETDPPPKHVLRYLAATHCVHEFMPRKIEAALFAEVPRLRDEGGTAAVCLDP